MSQIHTHTEFDEVLKTFRMPLTHRKENFHIYRIEEVSDKDKEMITPPIRQHFFDITLFIDATVNFRYAFKEHIISDSTLQLVAPRQVQLIHITPDEVKRMRGFTIYFKPDFLCSTFDNVNFGRDFPYFNYNNLNNVINLNYFETYQLAMSCEQILEEYKKNDDDARHVISGYLWALLHQIKRITKEQMTSISSNKAMGMVSDFQSLIADKVSAISTVKGYADKLCISPKHLSETLKAQTGQNAQQFIQEALMLEAKTLIKQTNLSVSEIAYSLDFDDVSNFTKFFKRLTGQTPSVFRLHP
jgi:AraC family transcriptional regulator, transcriptional activator of pobA